MTKADLRRWRPYIIWAAITLSIKAVSPAFSGLKGGLSALFTGILLLYATFIYYWFRGKEMTFLRVVSVKRSLLWFAALALVSSSVYGLTVKIVTGHLGLQKLHLLSGTPSLHFWLSSLLLTSLPEELFFRGFLFDHVDGRPGLKIVATALLFCGTHIAVSFTPIRAMTVIPGLLLGFLRYKTGEIYTPILLHTLFNMVHWTLGL